MQKRKSSCRLAPNLEPKGRALRAGGAVVMAVAAIIVLPKSAAAAAGLTLAAGFLAFEATRGWCALRACGIKTRF
jgi:hypothetical protein